MRSPERIWAIGLVVVGLLALCDVDRAEAATTRYSGVVLSFDQAAGTIVLGDMGPKLQSGKSEMARRRIRVTSSTSYVRVKRAAGVASSGWLGDYVETGLTAKDIKPGDWVIVFIEGDADSRAAARVMVVDTSEP